MLLVLKKILLLSARLGVGLVVATATLYFLVLAPHQQALKQIENTKKQTIEIQKSLEGGSTELKGAPGPSVISTQTMGSSKDYVGGLDHLIQVLDPGHMDQPKLVGNSWFDKKVDGYNELIKQKDHVNKMAQGLTALDESLTFLKHHREVMFAVANLLEYNPAEESKDKAALEAAAAGIDKTITRLKEVSEYKGDSMDQIIQKIQAIQTARQAYGNALGSGASGASERNAYINAVKDAQNYIVSDRQGFWEENLGSLTPKLDQAAEVIRQNAADIQNL